MLAALIRFSLTQRLLLLVFTVLLAGAGWVALRGLPIDAFPDVSTTQVKVIIKAPGMTPEEVEKRIVIPIEQELLGIPKQRILRSMAKYAIADVTIDFEDGTDIYWARQQVGERLAGVMRDLPPTVDGGMAPITTPLGEMFMFTIEGELSLSEKRALLDWVLRPALRTVPGVADVNSLGGEVRAFEVVPDVAALAARGISLGEVQQVLEQNNRNDGAGRLSEGEETLLVRAEGSLKTLDEVAAVVLKASKDGKVVRLGDVATLRIGAITRYGAVFRSAREEKGIQSGEAVEGLVLGLRGANARAVVDGVQGKLAELAPSLPKGVKVNVFYDRSKLVDRAVQTVAKALAEAIVLVLVLLLAFLGNLRAAAVVAAILPLAALVTFILMQSMGMSANLMSLGGLAIAIGMLVDAAVVVVENIESQLASPQAKRLPNLHLIYRAVREVAAPVTSGITIIIIVFLPLLSLQGLEGKMFGPVALTIVFALSASLVLSLTVVPVLASFALQNDHGTEPWLVRKMHAVYEPLLRSALNHSRRVFVLAGASLVLAVGAYFMLGKTFMPTMDEGDLIVQLEKLPSISLDQSLDTDRRVHRAILEKVPEVERIVARSGSDELGLDPMGLNQTDTFLVLKPRDQWRQPDKDWLADQLRDVLQNFPGVVFSFTQPIDMRVSEMLTGVRGDVAVKVYGQDLDALNKTAESLVAVLKAVPGAEDVITLKNEGVQYLKLEVDRLAAGRYGLNADAIQADLRRLVEGRQAGVVIEGNRRTPLLIRGEAGLRTSQERFAGVQITAPNGEAVPLSNLVRIERTDGPVKIDRENSERYVVVQANVRGRDLVGYVEEAKQAVASKLPLPAGSRMTWGGQFENQQRAAARLAIVVPVALALIFLLLFSTFNSVRQAALVLAMVPFALVGGVLALGLAGEYLSVPASVGFIALLGIAVLNGVVMVSYFNQLVAQGMDLSRVVLEGANRRLRPVMMTATIAALGLVPLLFASGPGSEIQRPLAIVVIGGLISSTALTLILLPILYLRFGVDKGLPNPTLPE